MDKNEAYQEFKNNVGADLNNSILKNIEDLKQKKEDIKLKTEDIQKKKDKLEEISSKLHQKEDNKTPEELAKNIIDEEEF